MTALQFLVDWAVRSSVLVVLGSLLLRSLRVKDASIRLAAWTAMLFGSLALPMLSGVLPGIPLATFHNTSGGVRQRPAATPPMAPSLANPPVSAAGNVANARERIVIRTEWPEAALAVYVSVALVLLFRLCVGFVMSRHLLETSRATGTFTGRIEIRESERITSPLTLGIARRTIVLPPDWRQWNKAKLDAVLAHECSHVRHFDPAVQLLSAIHRVLLWHSPLSWMLHKRIVRAAEQVSDDAAITAVRNRVFYAEMLLHFMGRGVGDANSFGVPMARYGSPDERIDRVLHSGAVSRGLSKCSLVTIVTAGAAIACALAAARPQVTVAAEQNAPQVKIKAMRTAKTISSARGAEALGTVTALNSVTVRPQVEGRLLSVSFKEGQPVKAGQLLASIDPRVYEIQLSQAEGRLATSRAELATSIPGSDKYKQLKGEMQSVEAGVEAARLQLSYAQVRAPISGVAGLRLIDPGNMVHAGDSTGLVVINQTRPIAVIFNVEEERLLRIRSSLDGGGTISVEAWNRNDTAKLATGRVVAIDNQIDTATGTGKIKAEFDNDDDALIPNQFVTVHLPE